MGERLIRTGRRLADDLNAEWSVIFVETPGHLRMPAENRQRMLANIRLAEQLGATVVNVPGENAAEAIVQYAHAHNITKIVAGKPLRPRWFEVLRGTVIDQIIRESGKIDVYVVSEGTEKPRNEILRPWTPHRPLIRYFASLVLIGLVSAASYPLSKFLDPTNLVMLYLMGVVIAAVFLGRGPAILASIVSVITFDFFFVSPFFSFRVSDSQYLLTFAGLLLVGIIISNFAALLRGQIEVLQQRNRQTQAINRFSRELTGAVGLEKVFDAIIGNIGETFPGDLVIFLPAEKVLVKRAATPGFEISETELAVADWSFKNNQSAGWGTDTLSASSIRYLPMLTARGTVGVLGIKPRQPENILSSEQRLLLEGFANLSALAVERASLAETAAQSELLQNKEKLQTALLSSISHELRTPLASITGVLTSLEETEKSGEEKHRFDPATRIELIESAIAQARQLNRLVENLLDMTRLEAGAIHLNRELADVQDLIGSVVNQMEERLCDHPLRIHVDENIPPISMDMMLIAQVLSNLLDNACKYSPLDSPIEIWAEVKDNQAAIRVRDYGYGIPAEDLERVFDKFYRVQHHALMVGTGLGLSICRGFIEAHGGRIWAENNPDRGITMTFTLPIDV
jgi:two-component system sensor histidine kinase KdpD